jgi:Leucine-rich repeat (LRR) protein
MNFDEILDELDYYEYIKKTMILYIHSKNLFELYNIPYFYNLEDLICTNLSLEKIPELPSNLRYLDCSHNKLKKLPQLPSKLVHLCCSYNYLKKLPELPSDILILDVKYNYLTELPFLPNKIKYLNCNNNKITNQVFPELPNLKFLFCTENSKLGFLPTLYNEHIFIEFNLSATIYKNRNIQHINNVNKILKKWKYLFYCLKFKKKFNILLWKIREKIAIKNFHPSKIIKLLEKGINIEDLYKYL